MRAFTIAVLRLGPLLFLLPGLAASAEEERDPEPFGYGRIHLGASAGYGHGFELVSAVDEVRMLAIMPRIGVGLTDRMGGDAWYAGNVDLSLEPQLLVDFDGTTGVAGGGAIALRYQFLAGERIVPFIGVGGGVLGLDFDQPRQSDGFNFILQGGVGTHYFLGKRSFLGERSALRFDVRWHHISNANLREPNRGIDSILFLVGVSWFPR